MECAAFFRLLLVLTSISTNSNEAEHTTNNRQHNWKMLYKMNRANACSENIETWLKRLSLFIEIHDLHCHDNGIEHGNRSPSNDCKPKKTVCRTISLNVTWFTMSVKQLYCVYMMFVTFLSSHCSLLSSAKRSRLEPQTHQHNGTEKLQ